MEDVAPVAPIRRSVHHSAPGDSTLGSTSASPKRRQPGASLCHLGARRHPSPESLSPHRMTGPRCSQESSSPNRRAPGCSPLPLGSVTRMSVPLAAPLPPPAVENFPRQLVQRRSGPQGRAEVSEGLVGEDNSLPSEPKFAEFFRGLSPNRPDVGIARVFLTTRSFFQPTFIACTLPCWPPPQAWHV